MKVFPILVLVFLAIGVHSASWADYSKSSRSGRAGYVQKDPIFRDRCDIYDRSGRMRGYTERDPIFKDRVDIHDRRGRREGYVEKDSLFQNRWNLYDRDGRKEGYVVQDSIITDFHTDFVPLIVRVR